ncbi:MAG: substrate-binding periplasmic protein [Planctomycetota bacterium]
MPSILHAVSLLLLFPLLLSSRGVAGEAKATPEFRVVYGDFSPFTFTKEGKAAGLYNEIAQKVLARAGISRVSLKQYPIKRIFERLRSGEADLWMGIQTPPLKDTVWIGRHTIMPLTIRSYFLKESRFRPKTKEDLHGHRIITVFGYTYGGLLTYFKDPANRIRLSPSTYTHKSAFRALPLGYGECLIDYEYPATIAIHRLKLGGQFDSEVISSVDLKWVISRKTPDGQALLARIEQAFIALRHEKKIQLPALSGKGQP